MGILQTVSLLFSNYWDSLQLRGFIDEMQSLRGHYVSKTRLFMCLPLFGALGKQLMSKTKLRQNIGNLHKAFLQESRTFQRCNLHTRLILPNGTWVLTYHCVLCMHDLKHTFKWCSRTRNCIRWFVAPSGERRDTNEKYQISSVEWSHFLQFWKAITQLAVTILTGDAMTAWIYVKLRSNKQSLQLVAQ